MSILGIDLQQHLPEIIEIYTEILGEQYRSIIEQRVYGAKYVYYKTPQGINGYHAFLRYCKSKELGIRFLKEIGIDIDEEKEGNSAEPYSEETKELLQNYLGSSFVRIGFMDEKYSLSGVKSFDEGRINIKDDYYEQRYAMISQIRIINFLRGNEEIDEYYYDEFKQTQEFEELKSKIEEYYKIYIKLLNEYHEYMNDIEFYNKYARIESRRRQSIAKKYDNDWQHHAIDIEGEEAETSEDFVRNMDLDGDKRNLEIMKIAFINRQVCVQELIGSNGPVMFFSIRDYDDGGKIDYMFLHEMFHIIGTSIRQKTEDEIREDSIRKAKIPGEIRTDLISDNRIKSGLDCLSDYRINEYNNKYRKYERLNETITDLFAMESMKRLHERGIYLFEDNSISIEDISNANTSIQLKEMVAPLIKEYKEEVKEAIIGDNIEILIAKIGIENFEEINDCINIVDALITGNLHRDYNEEEKKKAIDLQKKRCNKVYKKIKENNRVREDKER